MSHIKSLASPKALKIHRKEKTWIVKSAPGPHKVEESIPMGVVLRDYLGLAQNRKEVRFMLNNKDVLVDGRVVKSEKFPVGLLDIIEIPKLGKNYIIMVDSNARLYPKEADKKLAGQKLCKLTNKSMLKGGKLQLNFYDGKNLIVDAKDSKKYVVGGTAVVKLPEGKVLEFIDSTKDKIALVAKGRHAGKIGKVVDITESNLNLKSLTTLECEGEQVLTNTDFIFIVGDKQSLI